MFGELQLCQHSGRLGDKNISGFEQHGTPDHQLAVNCRQLAEGFRRAQRHRFRKRVGGSRQTG